MDFRHKGKKARFEVLLDVSERRRLEHQLRESQKMEALGRAVGGVAHDFNNLLTAVMLYCDLLAHEVPPGGAPWRHAEEISMAAQRGAALVRQMLAFARQQVLQPKVLSLNTIVLGMKNMLQRLIGEDITLLTRVTERLDNVRVDPAQMQQVVLNLVVNARDAMPAGGKLVIETANITVGAAEARRLPGLRPGRCVRLTVSDTGSGMSKQTLTHIFEPFFTTKEKGKGTGLGLPMVYGIVMQSGGAIAVESQLGKGTRVDILLPRAGRASREGKAAGSESAAIQGPPRCGSETVLVVEDDGAVREPAAQLLQEVGYTVLKARDGMDAMRLAVEHTQPIHLLITDVVMPGMSGCELARYLRARRPQMHVLYISGYGEQIRRVTSAEPHAAVLQKPFTQSALTNKVRQVLDGRVARVATAHAG